MNRKVLQERTKQFHIAIIKLCEELPRNAAGYEIAKQLIRSAGSVGANYRASLRAKSKPDFIYKIEIVLEEADESHYWLEILKEAGLYQNKNIENLIAEAGELTAMFAAIDKIAKLNNKKKQTPYIPKSAIKL